jgi:single-strand DNA-binding protein
MIKLQFIGYLGHDAVRKEVNGTPLLSFRAAHTRRFTNQQGEKHEHTTWVDCSLWKQLNVAPFLTTGKQVYLEGTPSVESYVTNAGEPMAGLKLHVTRLELLGRLNDESQKHDETIAADLSSKQPDSRLQEDMTVTNETAAEAEDLPF